MSQGGPFSIWELETFSKRSKHKPCSETVRPGDNIVCGAGCGGQGCPAEMWGGQPIVLPRKIIFGFPLKTSGCFWLSSKALHAIWQSLEELSHSVWLPVFMSLRDMPCAVPVTIRVNGNSLKNRNWYTRSRAAVKFPRVSSLSDVFHIK